VHGADRLVEHWLSKHKPKIDTWEGMLSQVYEELLKDKIAPVDSGKYLPPLKTADVFTHLAADETLADFGQLKKAEPGKIYKHQVIREINGVVVSGRRDEKFWKQIRQLTRHSDNEVRQAAFLAHTYLLPMAAGTEQFSDFVSVIDDSSEPAMIREAAFLAFSYHTHPGVLLKLHQVAADLNHPAWNAAVSRIGDKGQGFSVSLLEKLQNAKISGQQAMLLADSLKRLKERESQIQKIGSQDMTQRILLAVFAKQTADPNATLIQQWVMKSKGMMDSTGLDQVQSNWDFKTANRFWIPGTEAEFTKAYDELRAALLGRK
jgi:hypothetical protein